MKILRKILKVGFILTTIFLIGVTGAYLYAYLSPEIQIKNANAFVMYDNAETVFYQGSGSQEWTELEQISDTLIQATIYTEDKHFYNHHGFDILRIIKALYTNFINGKTVQGASTISQQYAKNLFLDFDKTWERKWKEMWITLRLETHYSKDEILEGYLNTINYGHGMYGIGNASYFYFGKSPKDLTLAESAMLVGIPKSPSNYSPISNYDLAKQRQRYVLNTLVNNGMISKEEALLSFTQLNAVDFHNKARGLACGPKPKVLITLKGKQEPLQIIQTALPNTAEKASPGTVLCVEKQKGILVQCKEGSVWLTTVLPAGKKAMPAYDYAMGHALKAADKVFN